jgi:hypothetical protein
MTISLYEGGVLSFLQTLDAIAGFMAKAHDHFRAEDVDPEGLVEARLFPDMQPLRFQIQNVVYHSAGAMAAIRQGLLTLPGERPPHDYGGLQMLIDEARESLRQLTPEAVDSRAGHEVVFEARNTRRVFTAEGFLLSFSLPNFHFHATTAYDILRAQGAPIGKMDYMGALRLKA